MPYIEDEDIAAAREVPFEATVPPPILQQVPQRIPQPPPGVNGGLLGDLLARQKAQKDAQWEAEQAAYEKAAKQTKWMNAFRGLAALADGLQGKQTKYGLSSFVFPPDAPKRNIDSDIKIQDIGDDPYIMQGNLPVGRYSTPEMETEEKNASDVRRLTGLLAGGGPSGWAGDKGTQGQIMSRAVELGADTKDLKEAMALSGAGKEKAGNLPVALQPYYFLERERNPEGTEAEWVRGAILAQREEMQSTAMGKGYGYNLGAGRGRSEAWPEQYPNASTLKTLQNEEGRHPEYGKKNKQLVDSGFAITTPSEQTRLYAGAGIENILADMGPKFKRLEEKGYFPDANVESRLGKSADAAFLAMAQEDPELIAFDKELNQLSTRLAKNAGEVGTLTDRDNARFNGLRPNVIPSWESPLIDTYDVVQDKLRRIQRIGNDVELRIFPKGKPLPESEWTAPMNAESRYIQLQEANVPVDRIMRVLKEEGYLSGESE